MRAHLLPSSSAATRACTATTCLLYSYLNSKPDVEVVRQIVTEAVIEKEFVCDALPVSW